MWRGKEVAIVQSVQVLWVLFFWRMQRNCDVTRCRNFWDELSEKLMDLLVIRVYFINTFCKCSIFYSKKYKLKNVIPSVSKRENAQKNLRTLIKKSFQLWANIHHPKTKFFFSKPRVPSKHSSHWLCGTKFEE